MTQELIDFCKGVLPIDGKRGTTVYFNSTVDVSRLTCKPFQNVLSDIPDEDGPYKSLNVTI